MAKSSAAPATKFEKLKELAEKATQSKWEHDGLGIESGRGTIARCPTPQNEGVFDCHQNAEYIAAANPKAILEILATHQALYKALSALHGIVELLAGEYKGFLPDENAHPFQSSNQSLPPGTRTRLMFIEDTLKKADEIKRAALALADAAQGA